ncbi:thiaminase II [Paenibacillus turpanensis]|uniref:thiaminase II n=1 Tax=Paenibacillus turpanensis TaxID=2689078 RepID=UPI00140862B3|nr:thiaminase II [Paenibacillus turpanensis]
MEKVSQRLYRKAKPIWDQCLEHPFLKELAAGKLEEDRFAYYFAQDYVYLIEYARLFALGCAKARDLETMNRFAGLLHSTLYGEMELHRSFARKFGISPEQLEATKPGPITIAYTGYMKNAAQTGTLAELLAALLPCTWSYWELGVTLSKVPGALDHPLYRDWILTYASDEVGTLAKWMMDKLDELAEGLPESELAHLEELFVTTSKFEYMFWDMAYNKEHWPV